jgi:hypothetical protein
LLGLFFVRAEEPDHALLLGVDEIHQATEAILNFQPVNLINEVGREPEDGRSDEAECD